MNIFSNPHYLEIAAKSFFPNEPYRIDKIKVESKIFQTLIVNQSKIIGTLPFMDFLEPLEGSHEFSQQASFLPSVSHKIIDAQEWLGGGYNGQFEASPFINWKKFVSFDQFIAFCQEKDNRAFSKRTSKKIEKISDELGAFRFLFRTENAIAADLLETLITWKAEQYARSDLMNAFAKPKTKKFFENLLEEKILNISAVFAGDRPLAIHAGFLTPDRFYYLLPAYDFSFRKYSAGTILNEQMMKSTFDGGIAEFDFLIGDELYKFAYANEVRVIGPLGERFFHDKVWKPFRETAMQVVRNQPFIYRRLQLIKRSLKEKDFI